jgi:hypothetical protein
MLALLFDEMSAFYFVFFYGSFCLEGLESGFVWI